MVTYPAKDMSMSPRAHGRGIDGAGLEHSALETMDRVHQGEDTLDITGGTRDYCVSMRWLTNGVVGRLRVGAAL